MEERKARLMPGAQWLLAQRKEHGWSQAELAALAGVTQDRVSAYERAVDEPPGSYAQALAEVLDLDGPTIWRALGLPLPREFMSDEDAIAWALAQRDGEPPPEERALAELPSDPEGNPGEVRAPARKRRALQ